MGKDHEHRTEQREKEGDIPRRGHLCEQRHRGWTQFCRVGKLQLFRICSLGSQSADLESPSSGAHLGTDLGLTPLPAPQQSPAVIDSPLKLELRVVAPPYCTIKPSGTTISVTASVTITLVPPKQHEVQLSSMIMVCAPE